MTETATAADLDTVAGAFRASVGIFAAMGATLYSELSGRCAEDRDMLALAALAPDGARPTALFSAVHYHLLGDASDPLARWFATLTDDPLPPDGAAFDKLRRFVAAHREELAQVLRTRTVQTTYAERCRALLPPMCEVARAVGQPSGGEPLNLIEIGCSGGVLLAYDKYAYALNGQGLIGDADSPVRLEGTLRGGPELFVPRIGRRIGIDLHTIDARSPEERRWLLSLCFPELRDEQRRLASALDLVADAGIELREGDGLALLPAAFATMPDPLCIYHSACLFYWPPEARAALEELFLDLSQTREFWRIAIEPSSAYDDWQKGQAGIATPTMPADKNSGAIAISHYRHGARARRPVARINPDYGVIDWID